MQELSPLLSQVGIPGLTTMVLALYVERRRLLQINSELQGKLDAQSDRYAATLSALADRLLNKVLTQRPHD